MGCGLVLWREFLVVCFDGMNSRDQVKFFKILYKKIVIVSKNSQTLLSCSKLHVLGVVEKLKVFNIAKS